jgi:hypothetical protein
LAIHAAKRRADHGQIGPWYVEEAWWTATGPLDGMAKMPRAAFRIPLPLGVIVATCELVDVVPISRLGTDAGRTEDRLVDMPFFRGLHLVRNHEDTVVEDQRPYGDFTPGRYAWVLSDIKLTSERCPLCWGSGSWPEMTRQVCPTCQATGGCAPVPARGKHRVWDWDGIGHDNAAVSHGC